MAQMDAQIKLTTTTNGDLNGSNKNNETVVSQSEPIKDLVDQMQQQQLIDFESNRDEKTEQQRETLQPSPPPPPPPSSSSAAATNNGELTESFAQLFRLFAKFGDSKSTGDAITLSNSDKWFKQAKIIDPSNKCKDAITTVDTGIYFKQVAKNKKALNFKEYNLFLEKLATVKKIDVNELKNKLTESGPPATNRTTTAVTSGAIGRLTDHTKYTGSHKQRFDETGKGRGKAGREDCPSNTGYVSGFKA